MVKYGHSNKELKLTSEQRGMDEERSGSVLNIDIEIIKIIKKGGGQGGHTWQMHGPKMMCSQSCSCSHQNHIHITYRS